MYNRIYNVSNPHQGAARRLLAVCSAGLLRSPTTAVVLSQEPYNYNTRAAGMDADHALIAVDAILLHWAQEIVCMNTRHAIEVVKMLDAEGLDREVYVLNIPDQYGYRAPELVALIKERYDARTQYNAGDNKNVGSGK